MDNLTVIGIGNQLASDDAIGPLLVGGLHANCPEKVSCLNWENADALTVAHDLLDMETPTLFVDAANMNLEPGSWRAFNRDQARLHLKEDSLSTHGFNLSAALTIASGLGYNHDTWIFGVQPFSLSPGIGLTDELKSLFPELTKSFHRQVAKLLQRLTHQRLTQVLHKAH